MKSVLVECEERGRVVSPYQDQTRTDIYYWAKIEDPAISEQTVSAAFVCVDEHIMDPAGYDACAVDGAVCTGFTTTLFENEGCHARFAAIDDGVIWVPCGQTTIYPTTTSTNRWDRARFSYVLGG
jgi:hypothetical protein